MKPQSTVVLIFVAYFAASVQGQAWWCPGACSADSTQKRCSVLGGCDSTGANATLISYKAFYYNTIWAACVGTTCPACALQQTTYPTMRQCENVCENQNIVYPPQSWTYPGASPNVPTTTQQPCPGMTTTQRSTTQGPQTVWLNAGQTTTYAPPPPPLQAQHSPPPSPRPSPPPQAQQSPRSPPQTVMNGASKYHPEKSALVLLSLCLLFSIA